jgi:hypothetical protein
MKSNSSSVVPCLNKADSRKGFIAETCSALRNHQIDGEVIVAITEAA